MIALEQKELFEEINILPIEVKTQLLDRLLKSINPMNSDIDSLWIEETAKRKAEIESGAVELVSGDEVFSEIAKRLNAQ